MSPRGERLILVAAIAVHLLAAWFSTGYHSADEFHQVIAFAGDKVQRLPPEPLPWEYAARIRSAFLPAAATAVFAAAGALGIQDFSAWTFLLRLLTAALALLAVRRFTRAMRPLLPPALHRPYLLLSWFLWFLPFLHVRFTGETWSGLFLLLALAELFAAKPARMRHARAGCLLGLAFLCRPPVLLAAIGLLGWLALVRKEPWKALAGAAGGLLAAALLGIALDSWFYGEPAFTAWNYLKLGIQGSPGHGFADFPWWYYFPWVIKYAIPVFGLPILAAAWIVVRFGSRHFLVWVLLPFLLLHAALPHKELRFLYPLADLVPLLLVLAWTFLARHWPTVHQRLLRGGVVRACIAAALTIDLVALACVTLAPAGNGNSRLAAYVRGHRPNGNAEIHYFIPGTELWRIKIPAWYLPPGVRDSVVNDPCISPGPARRTLLIARPPLAPCADAPASATWVLARSAIPAWKQQALRLYDWEDAEPAWNLYEAVDDAAERDAAWRR